MRATFLIAVLLTLTVVQPSPAAAAGPFDQGKLRLSLSLGSHGRYATDYFSAGASVGWFLIDGLEVSLGGDFWFGGPPTVGRIKPGVRYILHFVPVLKPYAGAFYRHWFVSAGIADDDSLGATAGLFWVAGPNLFVGGGILYEHFLSRPSDLDGSSLVTWELVVALTF